MALAPADPPSSSSAGGCAQNDEPLHQVANDDYLLQQFKRALQWPTPAEEFIPRAEAGCYERCPLCGEVCFHCYNRPARRVEWLCLEATCGARWCFKRRDGVMRVHYIDT